MRGPRGGRGGAAGAGASGGSGLPPPTGSVPGRRPGPAGRGARSPAGSEDHGPPGPRPPAPRPGRRHPARAGLLHQPAPEGEVRGQHGDAHGHVFEQLGGQGLQVVGPGQQGHQPDPGPGGAPRSASGPSRGTCCAPALAAAARMACSDVGVHDPADQLQAQVRDAAAGPRAPPPAPGGAPPPGQPAHVERPGWGSRGARGRRPGRTGPWGSCAPPGSGPRARPGRWPRWPARSR